MAHLVENMISTKGKVPWHGVGVVTPKELITAEEIIREIGFDFQVIKRQNTVLLNHNGKEVSYKLRDSYSTIRVNTDGSESILSGRVGRNYTPIQNVDAFGFFDNVVGEGEAIYETAGILKHGRTVFLLASLPEYIKILGHEEDKVRPYVLLANWHDGTRTLIAQLTNVRVVCNNTLNMALSDSSSQISIRHTQTAEDRMHEAARTMGLVNQYTQEMSKVFDKMARVKLNDTQFAQYLNLLIPENKDASDVVKKHLDEQKEAITELAQLGHGADLDTARGTLWGAYNAFVEYVDHGSKFRSDEARANSLLVGIGREKKQFAFNVAMDFVERFAPISVATN